MANPIDGSTTKVSQHALPVSLKPSNPNSFPLAYASDLRDIAQQNTDLAAVMGSTGQFTQAQINEAFAVETVTTKGFYTASQPPVSEEQPGSIVPANGGNYDLGIISGLQIAQECPAMTAGCTIRFDALTDIVIALPFSLTVTDGTYDATNDEFSVSDVVITPDTEHWYHDTTSGKYYAYDDDNTEYYEVVYPTCPAVMANASAGLSAVGGNSYVLTVTAIEGNVSGAQGYINVFSLVRLTTATTTTNTADID